MYRRFIFKKIIPAFIVFIIVTIIFSPSSLTWGFYSHRLINKMAVYPLPSEMIGFYKTHIEYISEHAVDPDKRTFADENEGVKHYIDMEHYGENPVDSLPHKWKDAVKKYSEDTLNKYGINPWWIEKMYYKLVEAYKEKNADEILWTSANLGHYIADGCVPLHHSGYYDGKYSYQKGVHALWESRIPELFADDYNFFVGKAEYIENINDKIWEFTKASYGEVDTVFSVIKKLDKEFPGDKKYSYENRGGATVKVVSKEYSKQFSDLMNNMVERRIRTSVMLVCSFWYTAWVNAGQPDLSVIENKEVSDSLKTLNKEIDKMWKTGKVKGRANPE
ncbi:MAG TPA: zinc dependent phospholipase C family protein [Bacteroidales bacterium]|nr:zinc dependent phospholipase C family protein [Bacteroidales bacterium]HPS17504.1 zinc dependent phospholipase C family protein [Bacteroidales bacterium]